MPRYTEQYQREVDRIRALQRQYEDDPLWIVASSGTRRRRYLPSKKAKAKMRIEVFTRDGFACQVCGYQYTIPPDFDGIDTLWERVPGHLALDHIIPYSKGGQFSFENLRACCERCNMRRGTKPIEVA